MDTLSQSRDAAPFDPASGHPWKEVTSSSASPRSLDSAELENLQALTDSVVEKTGWYEEEVVRMHNQLARSFGIGAPVQRFEELADSSTRANGPPAASQSTILGNPEATWDTETDESAGHPSAEDQRNALMHFEPCQNLRLRLDLHPGDKDFVSHAVDKQLSTTFKQGVSEYVRQVLLEYLGRIPLGELKDIGASHASQCFRKLSNVKKNQRRFLLENGVAERERGDDGFIGGLEAMLDLRLGIHRDTSHAATSLRRMAQSTSSKMPSKFSGAASHKGRSSKLLASQSGYPYDAFGIDAQPGISHPDAKMAPSLRSQFNSSIQLTDPTEGAEDGGPFRSEPSSVAYYRGNSAALLRWREVGGGTIDSRRVRGDHAHRQLRSLVCQELKPWREWSKAAKDVLTTVWSPSGRYYAIGATSDLDPQNIQYNDRGTLLYGDLEQNELRELDDHKIDRFLAPTGANALEDTYNTLDPFLYTTVTGICFDGNNEIMYSSSYDKTVKIWDVSQTLPVCRQTLVHPKAVEVLDVAPASDCLATIQDRKEDAVTLFRFENGLAREVAKAGTEHAGKCKTTPTCLQFGKTKNTSHLLLAGFSEDSNEYAVKDREGQLCLFDIRSGGLTRLKLVSSSRAVYDVLWSHHGPYFAAAMAVDVGNPTNNRARIQSHIRTWSPLEGVQKVYEFDCPALDVNELRFHPFDPHYVSASCTDGATYVWDARMTHFDRYIARLQHGHPIDAMDDTVIAALGYPRAREELDTGVKLAQWDNEGKFFYTGSSDGVIVQWNPWVAEEDALVRNVMVAQSGITAGSFSPDYSHLLIGFANGETRILSSSPITTNCKASHPDIDSGDVPTETIKFIPAKTIEEEEHYTKAAEDLLASGEVAIYPHVGAMKGPLYKGPYALWARKGVDKSDLAVTELDPDVLANQIHPYQWQKGLKAGGKPTVAAQERQKWLQERRREDHITSSLRDLKRAFESPGSTESAVTTPARKRLQRDELGNEHLFLDSSDNGIPTPQLSTPDRAQDSPTHLPLGSQDSGTQHKGAPATPSKTGIASRTPAATMGDRSTSDSLLRSFPIRTPSPAAMRMKSSPYSGSRSQVSDHYTPRPRPQFRMPPPAPESPFRDRIMARSQNLESARTASKKGEVIVLDDDDN